MALRSKSDFESKSKSISKSKSKFKSHGQKPNTVLKLLVFLIVLLAVLVIWLLSPYFNIIRVEVSGNSYYSEDYLQNLAQVPIGENGFKYMTLNIKHLSDLPYLRLGKLESNLLDVAPYIKTVIATFSPPSHVSILINERDPACMVPFLGSFLLVDSEGYVLKTVASPEGIFLPQLKGIDIQSFEMGQALLPSNPEVLETFTYIASIILAGDRIIENEKKVLAKINFIDTTHSDDIIFRVEDRITVKIGSLENLDYKMAVFREIFNKNIKESEEGLLDFTNGENPVFVPVF
ncbi:MAG: cell division protein FtsQ/DivIB [Clostridiales bacterium]|nr:cell division protein FtsQ/DivIB [Clostridiales bacterium]